MAKRSLLSERPSYACMYSYVYPLMCSLMICTANPILFGW